MGTTATEDYDVAVVGYGFAGETAAGLLARQGHRVVVFERWPSMYGLPRTISFDGESQRIVSTVSDIDEAMAESSQIRTFDFVDAEGNLITRRQWGEDEVLCGFYNRVSFYQPNVEAAMDKGARSYGAVINLGWEVVGVAPDDEGVTVTVRQHFGADNATATERKERTVRVKYVVGADGANSAVRKSMKAEWTYFDYRDAWLSIDVNRKVPLERLDPTVSTLVIAPERVVAVVPIGTKRIRFEFLLGGEPADHQDLSRERGYEFLKEAFDVTADEVEIYRQVVYPFEGRMSSNWREGRVLLAGDAAHLMPPFTGMGACSAVRDSANLAWKLDLVLRGLAPTELLESYEQERAPHTQAFIELGVGLGQMCTISDPVAAAARDAAIRAGGDEQPPDPQYDRGILLSHDGQAVRPAGLPAPQGVLRRGDSTGRADEVTGSRWGFELVVRDVDLESLLDESRRARLDQIGCRLVTISQDTSSPHWVEQDRRYDDFLTEHGVIGFLARPDFRVFAGLRSAEDIAEVVDELLSQLSGATVPQPA